MSTRSGTFRSEIPSILSSLSDVLSPDVHAHIKKYIQVFVHADIDTDTYSYIFSAEGFVEMHPAIVLAKSNNITHREAVTE